jgi:hypothetical protein
VLATLSNQSQSTSLRPPPPPQAHSPLVHQTHTPLGFQTRTQHHSQASSQHETRQYRPRHHLHSPLHRPPHVYHVAKSKVVGPATLNLMTVSRWRDATTSLGWNSRFSLIRVEEQRATPQRIVGGTLSNTCCNRHQATGGHHPRHARHPRPPRRHHRPRHQFHPRQPPHPRKPHGPLIQCPRLIINYPPPDSGGPSSSSGEAARSTQMRSQIARRVWMLGDYLVVRLWGMLVPP